MENSDLNKSPCQASMGAGTCLIHMACVCSTGGGRRPHNIWLKSSRAAICQWEMDGNAGTLLKDNIQNFICSHSPWALEKGGQSGLQLYEQKPGLGALELELRGQPAQFPMLSQSLAQQRTPFSSEPCYPGNVCLGGGCWKTSCPTLWSIAWG